MKVFEPSKLPEESCMTKSGSSSSSGISFCGLLAILFIGLKLTNHIQWSWLWVLSPIWIPIALAVSFLSLLVALGGKL